MHCTASASSDSSGIYTSNIGCAKTGSTAPLYTGLQPRVVIDTDGGSVSSSSVSYGLANMPFCAVDDNIDGELDSLQQFGVTWKEPFIGDSTCFRRDAIRSTVVARIRQYFGNDHIKTYNFDQNSSDTTLCAAMYSAMKDANSISVPGLKETNAVYIIVTSGALIGRIPGNVNYDDDLLAQSIFPKPTSSTNYDNGAITSPTSIAVEANSFHNYYNCAIGMSDLARVRGGKVFTIGIGYAGYQHDQLSAFCLDSATPSCKDVTDNFRRWCSLIDYHKTNKCDDTCVYNKCIKAYDLEGCVENNTCDDKCISNSIYKYGNPKACQNVKDNNSDGYVDCDAYQGWNNRRHDIFLRRLAHDPLRFGQIRYDNQQIREGSSKGDDCHFMTANNETYESVWIKHWIGESGENIHAASAENAGAYFSITPIVPQFLAPKGTQGSSYSGFDNWEAGIDSIIGFIARRTKM